MDTDTQIIRGLMSSNKRLGSTKAMLGITSEDQDEILTFVIQTIEKMVLSYINQDTLPAQLEKVLTLIAVSYYKSAGFGDAQAAAGPVASVTRGDVQTSFSNASGASGSASTFNLGQDGGDFFGWKTVLNEYRILRW